LTLKTIEFTSITGFTLTGGKKGDLVLYTRQINCKDNYSESSKQELIDQTLKNIVIPQIKKRIDTNRLNKNFVLDKAHVIMFSDDSCNKILLNEKVRFMARAVLKDEKKKSGTILKDKEEIKDILGLYPDPKYDKDAAHIMLVNLNNKWYCACDLIYNRNRVQKRFENAKDFHKVSDYCMKRKLWGPFVDTQYSTTELVIQSILLLTNYPIFSKKQDHDSTKNLFSKYAKNGNLDTKFSEHYDNLLELRRQGRYLNGVPQFSINEDQAKKLFNITSELIMHTEKLLRSLGESRPTTGKYLTFGHWGKSYLKKNNRNF